MCAAKQGGRRVDPRFGTKIGYEKYARKQPQFPAAALKFTK